ncbi:MAG: AraC family transcriptional regulator [Bacteroidia bacterium]
MKEIFDINRLNLEEIEKIISEPDIPHNHDYEELIIGMEGAVEHFIDFKSLTFNSPYISFVTKGKLHRVFPQVVESKCSMWVIRFKSEFIPEITFRLYSYYHDHANIQMQEGNCFDRMVVLCEMMFSEKQETVPDYSVIRHLLSALFTMIESQRMKLHTVGSSQKNQNTTFRNFLIILEENFRRPEGAEFYAGKLFMSSRNLNLICQNILQQSVTEIIETRKLIEAKNLLTSTDKTISEIGYDLGFNEKAYFSSVFKRKTGQTPSEFREEMSRLIS